MELPFAWQFQPISITVKLSFQNVIKDLTYRKADRYFLADFIIWGDDRFCLISVCSRLSHGLRSGLHTPTLVDLDVEISAE